MRKVSLAVLVFINTVSFNSCKQNPSDKENGVSTDIIGAQGAFEFAENAHDFGKIIQGEKVSYSFKFKNNGSSALVISSAHGSCGCTVPRYPKEPIAPGAQGVIDVTFDSDSKSGMVSKTVTLVANTNPNTTVLTITAEVEVPEKTKQN